MKKISASVFFLGTFVLGTAVATAASDPIASRQAIMKTVGIAAKASAQMTKGQVPFDAMKAELALPAKMTVPLTMFVFPVVLVVILLPVYVRVSLM